MPFREKAKNLFKSKRNADSLSTTSTNDSNHDKYQPGESMPPPKYRRQPQKEHKDKLEAFSFGDAWRKRSFQSTHSPMGTRASSRRTSFLSQGRKSIGRKSVTQVDEDSRIDEGDSSQQSVAGAEVGDPGNASGQPSANKAKDEQVKDQPNVLHQSMSTAGDHQPFSEQELASAFSRSHTQEVAAQS